MLMYVYTLEFFNNPDNPYWDEYCKIMSSEHCENKKEYKEKYKND